MDLIKMDNGQPLTTSRIVADAFKKTHKDVLRAVDKLDCSEEFRGRNFALSSYKSVQGKTLKCVDITRDGFSFLCMGFTGKEAAKWKEAYIKAFNEMEDGLLNIDSRMQSLSIEQNEIKQLGSEWAKFGHDINKKKKSITKRIDKLVNDVQLKLDLK